MTGTSKGLKRVLGVRSHSGWAAYVVLQGSATAPEIVSRGRMTLCNGHKQPFHEAESMPFARAEAFIAGCRATADRLADAALKTLQPISGCCVLSASGKPLPDLGAILASHALIHSAEGEFYRDAIAGACGRAGIAASRTRERDLTMEAEHLPQWRARLVEFGKIVGSPWTQDEKLAALGAWLLLAAKPSKR
jgi:hypothetical protein